MSIFIGYFSNIDNHKSWKSLAVSMRTPLILVNFPHAQSISIAVCSL